MIDELILVLGQLGIVALLGILGAFFFRDDFNPKWFAFALALYLMNDFLLTRGMGLISPWPQGAEWNWLGKLLALTASFIVAANHRLGLAKCGVTTSHRAGSKGAVIVSVALTVLIFALAVIYADGPDSLETIAFQWTMPGLEEELFYRGILLLALNEAFRARAMVLGAPIGYGGFLTMVFFGLAHALDHDSAGFSFDLLTFAITGIPSFILLWLREKTGSLLLPVLMHNVVNGAFTLF